MKTIIYFARHGEVHNPKKVVYGRLPGFRLSKIGREQIRRLAFLLKDEGIEIIYSSPMLRARQSARIIADIVGIKPMISSYLTELRHLFQGMPSEEYKLKIQPYLFSPKYIRKGQESVDEVFKRMENLFKKVINRHPGKKILIVSHGDPISIFVAKTSNLEFTWEYKKNTYLSTSSFFKLEYENNVFQWRRQNK